MPSIYSSDNPGPGALPTFSADLQQTTRVREFQGTAGQEMANVFGGLSRQLGDWEDRAATAEGVQQGKVAGLDPNYRPDDDYSMRGMARRNAANETYLNSVEAQGRSAYNDVWDKYAALPPGQQSPDALKQMLDGARADLDQNHVFPQIKGAFDSQMSLHEDALIRQASATNDARLRDNAKASWWTNANSIADTGDRLASMPATPDATLADNARQFGALMQNGVYNGNVSAVEAAQKTQAYNDNLAVSRGLTTFANLPPEQRPAAMQRFAGSIGLSSTDAPFSSAAIANGDYYGSLRRAESGGNDAAVSPAGAVGRYQFMPGTWAGLAREHPELNLTPEGRSDPEQQERAVRAFTAENENALRAAGIPVDNSTRYMAAFLGAGGATQFFRALSATPGASFAATFPREAVANPSIADGRSLADVYSLMSNKINSGSRAANGMSMNAASDLMGKMQAMVRGDQASAEHVQKSALADLGSAYTQIEGGVPIDGSRLNSFRQNYLGSADPTVHEAANDFLATNSLFESLKGKSVAEVDAAAQAVKAAAAANGADPRLAKMVGVVDGYAARYHADVDKDPLGAGATRGLIPPLPPLDISSPDGLSQGIRARMAAGDQVAQKFGLPRAPLVTPDDKEVLKSVAAAGGEPMVQVASGLAKSLGPRLEDYLSQVGGEAPSFAHMGRIAAKGGDLGLLRDAAWAIGQDHQPGSKVERPSPEALQQSVETTYGSAFRMIPDFAQGAKNLASSALAAQIMREGYDPKDLPAAAVQKTLQQAAGATFKGNTQYGGLTDYGSRFSGARSKVLIPGDVRADLFGDVVNAITDADLKALPDKPVGADGKDFSAARIKGAYLTSYGPGVYGVSVNDPTSDDPHWAVSPDKSRFLLDINKLEPALRQRVAGAFK